MIKGNFYLNDFNAGVIGEKFKGNIASEIVKRALRGSQNCIPIDNGGFSRRNGFQFIDELPIPSANTEYRLEMVIGDAGTEYLLGFYPGGVQVFDKEGVVLAAALETQMYSVWDIDLVSTIAGVVLVDGIVEPVLIGLDSTPTSDIYANFIPRPYAYYYAVVTNSGTTFTVSNPADPTGLDEFGNAVDYLNLMGDALVGMFFLVYREPATAYELHGQITSVAYSSGRVLSFTYDGATDRIAGSINTSGARIVLIYPESWGPTAGFKFLGSPDTMSFSYFHPNKVTIHENRLVFGGLLDYSTGKKDGDHWSISAINSIRTFPPYSAAAGSFELVPVQPDAAFTWIYSHKRLYYGTANGIFQFGQIDNLTVYSLDSPVIQSVYGGNKVKPIVMGSSLVYIQKGGKKLRVVVFRYDTEQNAAYEVTRNLDFFEDDNIIQLAHAEEPFTIGFAVTDGGKLYPFIFDFDEKINAWAGNIIVGDKIESVSVVHTTNGFYFYASIQREVGGADVRTLERMSITQEYVQSLEDINMFDSWEEWEGVERDIIDVTQASEAVMMIDQGYLNFDNGDLIEVTEVEGMIELNDEVFQLADQVDDVFGKVSDPASLPTDDSRGCAFSQDGIYLAVVQITSPFINIYKRDGTVFTKLSDPADLPVGDAWCCCFSPDSTYLVVGHDNSPLVTIYKRDEDAFVKLPDPASLPTGSVHGVSFSSDGLYLTVGHETSPYFSIYKIDDDVFTKLPALSGLISNVYTDAVFSNDDFYLILTSTGTPYITIYKRAGDVFTKLPGPDVDPAGQSYGCTFSPDGVYLVLAHFISPFITIYKRDGDSFVKLSDPSDLPGGYARDCSFSLDGFYLALSHDGTPYITIYKRAGDVFTKLSNPADLPASHAHGCSFGAKGNYLAVSYFAADYIMIYRFEGNDFKLKNPEGTAYIDSTGYSAYTSGGKAKEVKEDIDELSRLEGRFVDVLHLGTSYEGIEVIGGKVDIGYSGYFRSYFVGLPYLSYIQPFLSHPLFLEKKSVVKAMLNLYKSFAGKYGNSLDNLYEIPFQELGETVIETALYSEFYEIEIDGSRSYDPLLFIVQDKPYPMNLLSLMIEVG